MTLSRQRLLIFLTPIFLALPFLNRAYFVDDHFFVEIARWITQHPTHPYDFPTDGISPSANISKEDIALRIVNPLLHHFYLAALIKIGGERERFLRLGCVLLSCIAGLLIFELARRWTKHPFVAALLVLVTPAYWLTSYSLLIDSTLTFFFLAALYTFILSGERNSLPFAFFSGLLMGCALLTKYTAILILPVSALWWTLQWRTLKSRWLCLIPWGVGLLIFSSYAFATQSLYGQAHILSSSNATLHMINGGKALVLLVFLSGGSIAPLLVWPTLQIRSLVPALLVTMLLAAFFSSSLGGFTPIQAGLIAVWFSTGAFSLISFIVRTPQWVFPSDYFVFFWLAGFLAMMTVVMQWVSVRYFVMAIPPLVFLTVRLVEMRKPKSAPVILKLGLALTFSFGLALAYADYHQAESSRYVVSALEKQNLLDGTRNYYFSEAFTMTYLAKAGWRPSIDPSKLTAGDRVMASEITMPLFWFLRSKLPLKLVTTIEYSTRFPIKVMDFHGGAGFYASAWGPLPFTFSIGPWERFYLFEIIENP